MSKLSQELRTLIYLHQHVNDGRYHSASEIASELECSPRQARRYLEDLSTVLNLPIQSEYGQRGGYRLERPLSEGLALSQSLVLALGIALRRNEHIEKALSELPNYVVSSRVEGDNSLDDETYGHLQTLLEAIDLSKSVTFEYGGRFVYADPYKVLYANHRYYLLAVNDGVLKKYDAKKTMDIKILGSFKQERAMEKEAASYLTRYGLRQGAPGTLRVKCVDLSALDDFDRYYEGMGKMDEESLIYEVEAADEHELYYPLFRISTKRYRFLDAGFKQRYVAYLQNQIRSIEQNGIESL